ncbi:MAG: hypothetical protein ACKO04_09090 [Actinomycetes bacterium]
MQAVEVPNADQLRPRTTATPRVVPDASVPGRHDPVSAAPGPSPGAGDGADRSRAALRAQVDATLRRYDLALTALAARPDQAGDPASAERRTWAAVVVVGSALDEAMVEEVVRRGAEEDGAVLPPPGGLSYRHTTLSARATVEGTVFTWCGHAPGIGVERSSGTVVDDAVGHSHGTGLVVMDQGTARLAELEQTRLEILPPGTPDPCPAEVRP